MKKSTNNTTANNTTKKQLTHAEKIENIRTKLFEIYEPVLSNKICIFEKFSITNPDNLKLQFKNFAMSEISVNENYIKFDVTFNNYSFTYFLLLNDKYINNKLSKYIKPIINYPFNADPKKTYYNCITFLNDDATKTLINNNPKIKLVLLAKLFYKFARKLNSLNSKKS